MPRRRPQEFSLRAGAALVSQYVPEVKRVSAPEDKVEVFDVEQGSDEWRELRRGIMTTSVMGAVMAESEERKMRTRLLHRLAGEILTGEVSTEEYTNRHMERGKEMEPEARSHYSFTRQVELTRVGFVRRTIDRGLHDPVTVGASPDSLIGDEGVLEIKTMLPSLMVELAESGRFPSEHRAQCQGVLWITGRQWCDLVVYYRHFPVKPTFRVERDEAYIRRLSEAVEVFDYDLRQLVARVRSKA